MRSSSKMRLILFVGLGMLALAYGQTLCDWADNFGKSCVVHTDCCCGNGEADIVYLLDGSSSMRDNIDGVRTGLTALTDRLANPPLPQQPIDARHAVVLYGFTTELILDFTTDIQNVATVFNNVYIDREPGKTWDQNFQNEHRTWECSLEAVRMTLGYENGGAASFSKMRVEHARPAAACNKEPASNFNTDPFYDNIQGGCYPIVGGGPCDTSSNKPYEYATKALASGCWGNLNWRDGARKVIILVTDEDSDLPFHEINKANCGKTAGQKEPILANTQVAGTCERLDMDATANGIIDSNAYVYAFVDPGTTALSQWGNPALAVQDVDFSNFDITATQAALASTSGQQATVQNQVLFSTGLTPNHIVRTFPVAAIATDIVNIFDGVAQDIIGGSEECNCVKETKCLSGVCQTEFECTSGCDNCIIAGTAAQGWINDCVAIEQNDRTDMCNVCCGITGVSCLNTVSASKTTWVRDVVNCPFPPTTTTTTTTTTTAAATSTTGTATGTATSTATATGAATGTATGTTTGPAQTDGTTTVDPVSSSALGLVAGFLSTVALLLL